MKIFNFLLCTNLLIFLSSSSNAEEYMPSHWCYKPSKPLYFASSYDQKVYKKDTANYKLCIEVFIKSQKKDIGMHQQAIKVATDDWNNFIIGTQ